MSAQQVPPSTEGQKVESFTATKAVIASPMPVEETCFLLRPSVKALKDKEGSESPAGAFQRLVREGRQSRPERMAHSAPGSSGQNWLHQCGSSAAGRALPC